MTQPIDHAFTGRLRPHPEVVDTELDDGEVVLLHLEHKTYYSLNGTGKHVWQGIKQGDTVADIVAVLLREYEVEPQRAERSVTQLLHELMHEHLIEIDE